MKPVQKMTVSTSCPNVSNINGLKLVPVYISSTVDFTAGCHNPVFGVAKTRAFL